MIQLIFLINRNFAKFEEKKLILFLHVLRSNCNPTIILIYSKTVTDLIENILNYNYYYTKKWRTEGANITLFLFYLKISKGFL